MASLFQSKSSGAKAAAAEFNTSNVHMAAIVANENKECELVEGMNLPLLGAGEVLIRVHTSAINRLDTMQRKGLSPPPKGVTPVLGLEVYGEIVKFAAHDQVHVKLGWEVGDRVMALVSGGGNAEFVSLPITLLMRPPPNLSMVEAGALPETWLTAFQLLYMVGGFEAGKSVLIHAGGSGVGLAATQLAREGGASAIFVTAGSQDKIDMAKSMGATEGFSRHDNGGVWAPLVKEANDGKGVDVILDCVGASYFEQNAEVAAVEANWVLFGTLGGAATGESIPFMRLLMKKRLSLLATTLRTRSVPYKEELVRRFSEEALPGFAPSSDGGAPKYQVIVDRTFTLAETQMAHECMESNANTGKIALLVSEEARAHGGSNRKCAASVSDEPEEI